MLTKQARPSCWKRCTHVGTVVFDVGIHQTGMVRIEVKQGENYCLEPIVHSHQHNFGGERQGSMLHIGQKAKEAWQQPSEYKAMMLLCQCCCINIRPRTL